MPRLLRPIVASALASALALTAAASAMGAGWLPYVEGSNVRGGVVTSPKVAVDDAGNVYAAWIEGGFLEVSKRPVGGAFEPPQTLDPTVTTVKASNPDIAVDGTGNAVVVWTATDMGGGKTIKEARRSAGASSFGVPVTVTTPPGASDNARLAVNRAGQAVLAVVTATVVGSTPHGVVRVFLATASSDFTTASGAPFTSYDEGDNSSVAIADPAINEAGDASVVWLFKPDGPTTIHAAYRVHGASAFGPVEPVSTDGAGKHDPATAIDSAGNAVAVWDEDSATGGHLSAYARSAGGWKQLTDLDAPQSGGAVPDVGFDFNRIAVAAWSAGGELRTSMRPPGGEFAQPPQSLTGSTEQPAAIQYDSNPAGFGALVWSSGATNAASATVRPNGGAFGPITTLSPAGHGANSTHVAVDQQGNAAAVWIDSSPVGANTKIVTAEYDATAPTFTAPPSVPGTAERGKLTAFSVFAADDWSNPAIAWSFGDGATATGGGVSHAFAKTGTYTVTVTATDAAGNSATASRDVKVTEPVPPPTLGKDFNASAVSGTVFVSVPKGTGAGRILARAPVHGALAAAIRPPKGFRPFRRLGKNDNIPVGSILDATRGVTRVTMATNKSGSKVQTGKFSEGVFKTKQTTHSPLTSAEMLGGGDFKAGCKRPRSSHRSLSAARRRPHRQLFASVRGRFRTRGRHSTATVRGTEYIVKDSCSGTATIVKHGTVVVRDFRKHRTVIVRSGHRYLARQ